MWTLKNGYNKQMELNKSWADAPFIQFYIKIGARMKSLEIFN